MFTGIIEETGTVKSIDSGNRSAVIGIAARKVLEGTAVGDSIAVIGVCLTVTETGKGFFLADVMPESMKRTNLGGLRPGSPVNLERALSLQDRLGGHIVSGHVDGTAVISAYTRDENAVWITLEAPGNLLRYIVNKGSVAIDGVSLTVAYVDEASFKVSVIPHTGRETTLLKKRVGEKVNIENDIIARYIEKLQSGRTEESGGGSGKSGLTEAFLLENGF